MSATSEQAMRDPVEALPRERLRATVAHVLVGQPLGAAPTASPRCAGPG